mgnify:FL=1
MTNDHRNQCSYFWLGLKIKDHDSCLFNTSSLATQGHMTLHGNWQTTARTKELYTTWYPIMLQFVMMILTSI